MRTHHFTRGAAALTLTALALAGNQALAAEYWLRAAATTVGMPGPTSVPMWGYALCTPTFADCTAAPTVPGPALTVPPGDATLTVHLRNDLPNVGALPTPTSLVINGLVKAMAPVWTDGSTGARGADLSKRVRSFDAEAAPAGGVQTYAWGPTLANPTAPGVKPGTYLYQSGTQPQVQVQMGLYGALTKDFAAGVAGGEAYPGVAYGNQATLLYSEIDPALHAAVATGTYGTPAGPTSTFDYQPKFFLINGQPYASGAPLITPVGEPGQTLVRMLNAGLVTHVPMIQGNHWEVVAEDGKPYPHPRNQYTALLPAAKTLDVRLSAEVGTSYPIMDRRLNLSNDGVSGGGMLAFLGWGALASGGGVGAGAGGVNQLPVAFDDPTYTSVQGVTLNIAAPGVLSNDTEADPLQTIKAVAASGATSGGGTYALNANGSFTYTPPSGGFTGSDTFTYRATDGQALSALLPGATVTITVAAASAPTLALLDNFTRSNANNLAPGWAQTASTGSLANLQINSNQARAAAIDLGGQAIWTATVFGANQGAGFTAGSPSTNSALILKANGGTVATPDTYIRVRCEAADGFVVATMMSGSTSAVFVKQAAFPASCTGGSISAAVDAKGLVTVFQGGSFVGGVQLPDVPAWKGNGRIGIQLQTVGATIDNFNGGTLP